jgi:DNA polymerase I-like protein with 3'-5' exonuclease and polymerase domains
MEALLRPKFDLSIPSPHWVGTDEQAQWWLEYMVSAMRQRGALGIDTETTGLCNHRDIVLIWSLSDGKERIALPSKYLHYFKEHLLEQPWAVFDLSNAKFDAHMLANSGVDLTKAGEWRDTTVQSWLLNENNQGRHGLKECVLDHLGRASPTFEQVFGKVNKKAGETTGDIILRSLNVPPEPQYPSDGNVTLLPQYQAAKAQYDAALQQFWRAIDYASLDAYNTTVLREYFDDELDSVVIFGDMTLKDYFYAVEVPFTKVLFKMERRGVLVNTDHLSKQKAIMEQEMAWIRGEFSRIASWYKGEPYVLNLSSSSDDSKWFFYEAMGRPVETWTNGGKSGVKQPCLDAEVLEGWAGQGDQWAQLLLQYRKIDKAYGTYVCGLAKHQDAHGRIHTTLNQHGTVTGRLSSAGPNLQNITRASEDRFGLRTAFIAALGKLLLVGDYGQLEMRLLAHLSQDLKMVEAIRAGKDLHSLTLSEIEGIPYDEIMAAIAADKALKKGKLDRELTPRENDLVLKRWRIKATGFGIVYGIGGEHLAAKLTRDTGIYIPPQQGYVLIDRWLGNFPGVKAFIERSEKYVEDNGFVQTLTGRFRRFGNIRAMSKGEAARAKRQAVNVLEQGTGADVCKLAMIKIENDPETHRLGLEMLLQVHDELLFEFPETEDEGHIEEIKNHVLRHMEHPFNEDLSIPLEVELGVGRSWAVAK